MNYPKQIEEPCPSCGGSGYFEDDFGTWLCDYCDGEGFVIILEQEEEQQ